ncbi:hypothetical protein Patl1_28122 [Pistacia atlantica]|uniref:Uncharacterized protein n=1 Tax=Pistacia atlantica TaxID=434234 RepID=A0ACC1BH35_9ROSI|nr:hypothetical protein Patl1_28122 [Pistacia atlantica]
MVTVTDMIDGVILLREKPKQEIVVKSAAQIVHEQHGNMAPTARMAMTRRVHPLVSLNPYQGNWTIKVRVTSKGNMRTYKNARGEGCVFNVELTDQDEMYGLPICSRNIRIGGADGFGNCVGMVNSCWELPNIVLAGAITVIIWLGVQQNGSLLICFSPAFACDNSAKILYSRNLFFVLGLLGFIDYFCNAEFRVNCFAARHEVWMSFFVTLFWLFRSSLACQGGTQIQATMFNEATRKFYDRFQLGKVYYISLGTLRVDNKQFKTLQNDYEMSLNKMVLAVPLVCVLCPWKV